MLSMDIPAPEPRSGPEPLTVSVDGPRLGLAFEPDGRVKGIQPGSESEQKGMLVGDKIVKVGDTAVSTNSSIVAAVQAHPQRPLVLTLERAQEGSSVPAPVNATPAAPASVSMGSRPITITIDGPRLGCAFDSEGKVKGLQPGGEGEQRGLRVGDRVIKVGDKAVYSNTSIISAVSGHSHRPLVLTIERANAEGTARAPPAAVAAPPASTPAAAAPSGPKPITITIDGPRLGCAFEANGSVKGLQPGGEGEQRGMLVGDRVIKVGDTAVASNTSIIAAVQAQPQRPLVLTIERPKPTHAHAPVSAPEPDSESDMEIDKTPRRDGDFVVSMDSDNEDVEDPAAIMTVTKATAPEPEAEEEPLPSGSVATMNIVNLKTYARIKKIDISHCESRMDMIRTLAPELFQAR